MSFDPFEPSWPETAPGESRRVQGALLAAATLAAAVSLAVPGALYVAEPGQFAPLVARVAQLRAYAEAGYFPLMAAARAAGREPLATAVGLQLFSVFICAAISLAYGFWRGVTSLRVRGWSDAFWAVGTVALALVASYTPQKLDFLLATLGGGELEPLPDALLLRAAHAAVLAGFALMLGHDLGYRMREALMDFGLIEEIEATGRRRRGPASPGARPAGRETRGQRQEAPSGGDGFGHRAAPPLRPGPPSAEDRARLALGVGPAASKREIERAYRTQMKRAHPDHGGSVERAAALNAARDLLLRKR